MAKLHKFRALSTGVEFVCEEGSRIYERVTGGHRGDNEYLGEVKVKRGKVVEADAPAESPAEDTEE